MFCLVEMTPMDTPAYSALSTCSVYQTVIPASSRLHERSRRRLPWKYVGQSMAWHLM